MLEGRPWQVALKTMKTADKKQEEAIVNKKSMILISSLSAGAHLGTRSSLPQKGPHSLDRNFGAIRVKLVSQETWDETLTVSNVERRRVSPWSKFTLGFNSDL